MDGLLQMFSLLFLMTLSNTYTFKDEQVESLQRLISLGTREISTIIIYDESYDYTELMVNYNQPMLIFEYQSFRSFLRKHMESIMEASTITKVRSNLSFLLICRKGGIEDLMTYVTVLDNTIGLRSLLRHFSTWLIISPDPPPHLNITLDNVAMIRVTMAETNKTYIGNETVEQNMFGLKDWKQNQKSWTYSMTESYTLSWMPGGREWSRLHISDVSDDDLYYTVFPNIKRGLNGRQLFLATAEWRPHAIRHITNGKVTYVGSGVDAMDMLGRKFNFSYVIVEPNDMQWGRELENGSITGVLGMLQRAETDMCPVPYIIALERKQFMDFSSPFLASEYTMLYRKRKDDTTSWLYLLRCLSWQVYVCGLATLLWIFFLLSGMKYMTVSLKASQIPSFIDIAVHIPLRQAFLISPRSTSARIITWTWCIVCLVVSSVYIGKLVAFATVDIIEPPFTTLQELAEQKEYAVDTFEGGYAEMMLKELAEQKGYVVDAIEGGYAKMMLKNTDDPTLKLIYSKVVRSQSESSNNWSNENSVSDAIKRILNEKYVLIATDDTMGTIKSITCDVVAMKERLLPIHRGYAFPRNSPLRKLFDDQVILLFELGIYDKMRKKWTPKPMICDSAVHVPQVKLVRLKTLLLTCLAGILVAAVVLLFEKWKMK